MISNNIDFILLLSIFLLGALLSLIFRRNDRLANYCANGLAIIGSIWGIVLALRHITNGYYTNLSLEIPALRVLSFSIRIDNLSAFFIFIISLITLFASIYAIGYVQHYYKKYCIGTLGFFYNIFILGMLLVVSSSNAVLFLVAWEVMSVASYFLVIYDNNNPKNVKAGLVYLVMTHVATAFIIILFLILFKFTGSFDFEIIKLTQATIPAYIKDIVFVLALIGFGTKAGIIPVHIWLPSAHPAAPSHVSALMSGVMIKTGIFMMIRMFLDILQPVPVWWGYTVLIIGVISSLLGVILALTEHDIKRLLAYHSIENIGIIMLGIGSSLIFSSMNLNSFALVGLIAALFHTLNHAVFKSLLFLCAGSVINKTNTSNMAEYGGIIKYMPLTALFFLVGSMAISALPPFNGFYSEWITFQSLFQGIAVTDITTKILFSLSAGGLAFTGGFALMCFVKVFGITFLARPRSIKINKVKESSFSMLIGMGGFAIISLIFGVYSSFIVKTIKQIVVDMTVFRENVDTNAINLTNSININNNFADVSGIWVFLALSIALVSTVFVFKFIINRKQKIVTGETWDCGTDLTPRMEITSTAFASSMIRILRRVVGPIVTKEVKFDKDNLKYFPKSIQFDFKINDIYGKYIYKPITDSVSWISLLVKRIQGGNTNIYIMYILLVLLIALILLL